MFDIIQNYKIKAFLILQILRPFLLAGRGGGGGRVVLHGSKLETYLNQIWVKYMVEKLLLKDFHISTEIGTQTEVIKYDAVCIQHTITYIINKAHSLN